MENLKTEPIDEKEEGEISLEDVSSSEEMNYNNCNKNSKIFGIGKKHIKREVGILSQDRDHGKENRQFSNELLGTGMKFISPKLQDKNDDLLPISSDEDIEYVGLPGTSKQLAIQIGPKRKRKKKKKKKSGQRMLVIDDLVSVFDDEPDLFGTVTDDHRDFVVSRPYTEINNDPLNPIHRMDSPLRHSGWHVRRSPTKHYRSPLKHGRSPIGRSPSPGQKSPRKYLSPQKSPVFNSDRHISHKPSREFSHERHNDNAYASSLLKKVRQLETVGSITPTNHQKYKESSLKDKLNNMMIKRQSDSKENVNNLQPEIDDIRHIGIKTDDEEDLEFLRRKALETKMKPKNEIQSNNDEKINIESNSGNANISDDDKEDLKLRMIALRSAVMKKHHDRLQRGVMRKKSGIDIKGESPFSDSFLDSLDSYLNDADEPNCGTQKITTPISQISNAENALVEDMDLDSDVEREKENFQPYSPTDELPQQTLVRQSLPDKSQTEASIDELSATDIDQNVTNMTQPYSQNCIPHFKDYALNVTSSYLPLNSTSTPRVEKSSVQEPDLSSRDPRLRRYINSNTDISYVSSATTTFDPTLPLCSPESTLVRLPLNAKSRTLTSSNSNLIVVPLANNTEELSNKMLVSLQEQTSTLLLGSNIPDESLEILKVNTKNTNAIINKAQSDVTHNDIIRDLAEYTGEPLYLHGVPDITKDVNKIPTLVNRTLVPVPILKTNKQLQQSLPNKKLNGNNEPTFKSAEMLSINVQSQPIKSHIVFKPIKLQSVTKKNQVMITPAAAFNNTLTDEANIVLPDECSTKILENSDNVNDRKSSDSMTTDVSKSIVVPANELKTKVRRSRTPRTKVETTKKTQQKTKIDGKSMVIVNEKVKDKITIKRISKTTENKNCERRGNKVMEEAKKSDVNNEKKTDVKRDRRLKSITKFGEKSDKNLKNNSDLNKNGNVIIKQKKDIKKTSKTKSTKCPDSNLKKTNVNANINNSLTTKFDDKKRRSSIDEDEDALRAALLASLPKRVKTSNSQSTENILTTESVHSAKKKSNDATESSKEQHKFKTAVLSPASAPSQSMSKKKTSGQKKIASNTSTVTNNAEKKRSSAATIQGPPKKIVKTSATSPIDTTNIVNIAEKIVDTEIQRKLALQQAAIGLLFNKTQQNLKINSSRSNVKDSTILLSPKISVSKNMERMIIHLGEDSDTDSDVDDEDTNLEAKKVKVTSNEIKKPPKIPTTEFEKSVEEFLRTQREKQESSIAASTSTAVKPLAAALPKPTSSINSTPLAVRHLPASKQEEYRRLKQCIAEREQQKMNRTIHTSDTPLIVNTQIQPKVIEPHLNESQQIALHSPRKGISIQTEISHSALKLLESSIKTDIDENINNISGDVLTSPLLSNVTIKTDPSLLGMTSNIVDNSQKVDMSKNIRNEASELLFINSMQPMDNLIIRIPNTRDDTVSFARHVTVGINDDSTKRPHTPQVAELGLRILTTDQLNMKYEHTSTDINDDEMQIEDQKIELSDRNEMIDTDVSMPRIAIESIDNPIDTSITIETLKIETNGDIKPLVQCDQTPIDLQLSTVTSLSENHCSTKHLNNNGLDTTIELDSNIIVDEKTIINDNITNDDQKMQTLIHKSHTLFCNAQTGPEFSLSAQEEILSVKTDSDIQTELETLYELPENQQHSQLTMMEKELVEKRYEILRNVTQMADDLRQLKIEANLIAEVNQLRIQLQLAEERLQAQRTKTMNLNQLTLINTVIDEGRNECTKLTKLCQGFGTKIIGPAYNIPSTGNQLLRENLRKVSGMVKQLSAKKSPQIGLINEQYNNDIIITQLTVNNSCNENSQSTNYNVELNQRPASVKVENADVSKMLTSSMPDNSSSETLTGIPIQDNIDKIHETIEMKNDALSDCNNLSFDNEFSENVDDITMSISGGNWLKTEDEKRIIQSAVSYKSVLTALNTPRHMDPNGVLCPYELMGTCNDEACLYNHIDVNRS